MTNNYEGCFHTGGFCNKCAVIQSKAFPLPENEVPNNMHQDPTTPESIISTCDKLKTALLARYEASRRETEIKLEVIRTQNDLLIVKGELNSLRF